MKLQYSLFTLITFVCLHAAENNLRISEKDSGTGMAASLPRIALRTPSPKPLVQVNIPPIKSILKTPDMLKKTYTCNVRFNDQAHYRDIERDEPIRLESGKQKTHQESSRKLEMSSLLILNLKALQTHQAQPPIPEENSAKWIPITDFNSESESSSEEDDYLSTRTTKSIIFSRN